MLSRRNIRIKLLQIFYSYEIDDSRTAQHVGEVYTSFVRESYDLMLFVLYSLHRISGFADEDLEMRKNKYVPDSDDRVFRTSFASNEIFQALSLSTFSKEMKQSNKDVLTQDAVKGFYMSFLKDDLTGYRAYSSLEEPTGSDHLNMYLELMKFLLKDENYLELLDDHFLNVDTDHSLLKGALKKIIKKLPEDTQYYRTLYPDKDAVEDYGEALKNLYLEKDDELIAEVKKYLRNWDFNRVALLDKIILKMAILEFLYFPSIPIKVTLNEYVELAKSYSTDKSGDFINGVLDNMKNRMNKEGRIDKHGRGLIN